MIVPVENDFASLMGENSAANPAKYILAVPSANSFAH